MVLARLEEFAFGLRCNGHSTFDSKCFLSQLIEVCTVVADLVLLRRSETALVYFRKLLTHTLIDVRQLRSEVSETRGKAREV